MRGEERRREDRSGVEEEREKREEGFCEGFARGLRRGERWLGRRRENRSGRVLRAAAARARQFYPDHCRLIFARRRSRTRGNDRRTISSRQFGNGRTTDPVVIRNDSTEFPSSSVHLVRRCKARRALSTLFEIVQQIPLEIA